MSRLLSRSSMVSSALGLVCALFTIQAARAEDWPTLHHDLQRTGRSSDQIVGPFKQVWMQSFDGETVTTRCEPIVFAGGVYLGTCAGWLRCLDASNGRVQWARYLEGPILHSPSVDDGVVYAASLAGVWALDAKTGEVKWNAPAGEGGYCTSPALTGHYILLGGRDGVFRAFDRSDGQQVWQIATGGPVRTTAAIRAERVFFASEDMRAYAANIEAGELLWRSEQLSGQSMRDYYPVLVGEKVILRSNPSITFSDRISVDGALLAGTAGINGANWKQLDAYLHSDRIFGNAEAFAREQAAIRARFRDDPDARTCFVLDARTGHETAIAPVLWAAGCGGVGAPPVVLADGRCLVCYRTAYTNFSLGVAPLVGLGYLEVSSCGIEPIFHNQGRQPLWDTFWGTADECQNYSLGGHVLYISHQGTLAGFDLVTRRLFSIAGHRDTYGGQPPPAWTRNEWHGPARGSAAIAGDRLYWITGSRIIALQGRQI